MIGGVGAAALSLGLACCPASAVAPAHATVARSASAHSVSAQEMATERAATARDAVAALPVQGPVRVVGVSVGPGGRPEVRVEKAATPEAGASAIARMRADRDVTAIELDSRVHLLDHPISSDPLRSSQWGMTRLSAEHTWGATRGSGATVAVIDTGVDGSHPDLQGALVPGFDYVAGSGNGLVDPAGHGTHVAGIVVAVPGNGIGVVGLAPDARVMSLRVLDADGGGYASDVAQAIVDAADLGVDAINLSLGGPVNTFSVEAAVEYALAERGAGRGRHGERPREP